MDALEIIAKHYPPGSRAFVFLVEHGRAVAAKALLIARRLESHGMDLEFLEEAALLHDIGIFMTKCEQIGCSGEHPYISHGYLGRELLEREGFSRHALVCERHVGVGITIEDIERNRWPLPLRDMTSQNPEEEIICFADKFFSKREGALSSEMPLSKVREQISRYGEDKLRRFDRWCSFFREAP